MLYEPILLCNLEKLIERFAKETGTPVSIVQRRYALDSIYLNRIRRGAKVSATQYDRIACRLARDWPLEARWPRGVPRPSSQEIAATLERIKKEGENGERH